MDKSKNALNDESLAQINGGDATGSFIKNSDGSVEFTDKNNKKRVFTKEQWDFLRKKYEYSGNPNYYISTIPLEDLNTFLDNNNM
ncbi:MAG: hypothetical protein K6E53_14095 [Lachnospiraceae bacterium]|jgi:hypothetical protein|nr:hypothetical protein [Lachnospiraceae bacterium]